MEWADLVQVILAAVAGWLGRTYTPTRKPPGSSPARRK